MAGQGGGGGHNQNPPDDAKYIAMFIIGALLIWLLWTIGHKYIVIAFFAIDWVQYKFLDLIGFLDADGKAWLHNVDSTLKNLPKYDPLSVDWDHIVYYKNDAGNRMKWFYVVLSSVFVVIVVFKMQGNGFRHVYSLTGRGKKTIFRFFGFKIENRIIKFILRVLTTITFTRKLAITEKKEWVNTGPSFAHFQAEYWKVAMMGAYFDPDKKDPRMNPAMTPAEWLKENKIRLTKKEGLDLEGAGEAFKTQLGPMWPGLLNAPIHVQAIAVMSALNAKRDDARGKFRDTLTEIYVKRPKEAPKLVKELLAPFLANKKIVDNINKRASHHAFTNTAMLAVYGWGGPIVQWGGKGGVISSSMFLWLKKEDRTLWYTLNNLGRRTFHTEGAGAVSHFFVERVAHRPIQQPNIETALKGLNKYLTNNKIGDLDEYFNVEKEW